MCFSGHDPCDFSSLEKLGYWVYWTYLGAQDWGQGGCGGIFAPIAPDWGRLGSAMIRVVLFLLSKKLGYWIYWTYWGAQDWGQGGCGSIFAPIASDWGRLGSLAQQKSPKAGGR